MNSTRISALTCAFGGASPFSSRLVCALMLSCIVAIASAKDAEVIVYGGTPAGVMAAVAAARHGHPVALIDINNTAAVSSAEDCHVVQRLMINGKLVADRTPHIFVQPYDIPTACLTPTAMGPGNLLVPVCCSATHAAGDAAHLALAGKKTVQKVDVPQLRELLRKEGAVLDAAPPVTTETKPKVKDAKAPPRTPANSAPSADATRGQTHWRNSAAAPMDRTVRVVLSIEQARLFSPSCEAPIH